MVEEEAQNITETITMEAESNDSELTYDQNIEQVADLSVEKTDDTRDSLPENDSKLSVSCNAVSSSYKSCETQTDFTWNGIDLSTISIHLQDQTEEIRQLKEQLSLKDELISEKDELISKKDELIALFTLDNSASVNNEMHTSQPSSQTSVSGSDDSSDSSSTSAESEDGGSDPISSPAESDEDSLDCPTGSANSENSRHCSSTSEEYLAASILKAVHQKDKNRLLQILKVCKENNFPQSGKITDTCWRAILLAISSQSRKECFESLLEYDNGLLISLDDRTASHIISQNDIDENILVLLQKGYEFHQRFIGKSILHYAAEYGKSEIISLLSKHSVNINIKDSNGCTPLHLSVHADIYLEAARILLANGADVFLVDKNGELPLHYAIKHYSHFNLDMISLLVERDLTTINYSHEGRGDTPFFCALDCGKEAPVISYLLEKGARTVHPDSGITAFEYAASLRYQSYLLPNLLESVPINKIEKYCLFDISNNIDLLNTDDYANPESSSSLTCSAIVQGTTCLADLISHNLPEAVLQAPNFEYDDTDSYLCTYEVMSPLAFLFYRFFEPRDEQFDLRVDMLLKHKITMLDKFQSALLLKWPHNRVTYIHPFAEIFHASVPPPQQLHYFNLLNAHEVTIDYCLRCYHDNTEPFAAFTEYHRFYKPVMSAAYRGDVETVKLLISTSNILEPDILSHCVISIAPTAIEWSPLFFQNVLHIHKYLISLKPIYYECKHNQYSISPYSTASKRFSKATLKGLCRTAIREQLREPTLEDNLLNFRRKILQLPLPNLLKDYLLFKI